MTADPSKLAFEQTLERWRANAAARVERWALATRDLPCHACDGKIPARSAYRRVTKHDWPFCPACAKSRFDEEPPARIAEPVSPRQPVPQPLAFSRFNVTDITARRLGEREPGEEG